LDATVGGGGHALAILEAFEHASVLATDRDPEALEAARERLSAYPDRVRFVRARLDEAVEQAGVLPNTLSGALLDLGLSSHQLDREGRGFAFRRGEPLNMKMDAESPGPDASEFLNEASAELLAQVLRDYGDVQRAGGLARTIVRRRDNVPFTTSDDLVGALSAALGRGPSQREKARVFQAVRIHVNDEAGSLERGLPRIRDALAPGGTLVVIAYHSVEDRAAKHAFRAWSRDCVCPPGLPMCACRGKALGHTLHRRALTAADAEVDRNPRARSARLRAWRKAA